MIFGREASLQPLGVCLRRLTLLVVQFIRKYTVFCKFGCKIRLGLANLSKIVHSQWQKNQSPIKFVVLVRCNLRLISFWWSSETSFPVLLNMYTWYFAQYDPWKLRKAVLLMTFNWFYNFLNCFRMSLKKWETLNLINRSNFRRLNLQDPIFTQFRLKVGASWVNFLLAVC